MLDEYLFAEKEKLTFRLGETKTMIDYILANNKYRSSVKVVKVISGGEINSQQINSQHCLLSMGIVFKNKVRKKLKFRKQNCGG